ncbi:MAG: Txe/YoeB family addiction module toxin [Rikenellaceae bacterium]|jgi:toxin YoeB|nr:Txe/YoeB family addiction module toxin [Rikenellaceae bacterium]
MSYKFITTSGAERDIENHIRSGRKKLVQKVYALIPELEAHPRTGTGKPEQLRHTKGEMWSRRIDSKHRLVYEIREDELVVIAISAYGHYGEK